MKVDEADLPAQSYGVLFLLKLATAVERLKRHGRLFGLFITIGAVAYGLFLVVVGWRQLIEIDWRIYAYSWSISLLLYLISLVAQMMVWLRLISLYQAIHWFDIRVYLHTILLRQIPGGVWHWAGRATWYHKQIPARAILLASFIEWVTLLATALIAYAVWAVDQSPLLRISLAVSGLILVSLFVFSWHAAPKTGIASKIADIFLWTVAYIISWSMGGFILYALMYAARLDISLAHAVTLWTIAGGVSAITIVAPSGLGVRELSLVFLLHSYAPASLAVLIAVMLRLIFILSDLVWGGLGYGLFYFYAPTPVPMERNAPGA
jgi:uncharacterized membrane protein YbhN (UPF0104 family)